MHLDMQTMSAVNVAVTAVLGGVLLFTWLREHDSPFVGQWGLALLIQAVGVLLAASATGTTSELLTLGTVAIISGDALKWKASREFARRKAPLFWLLAGPLAFLFVVELGYLHSFDGQLNVICAILAAYNFAAALELASLRDEQITSRALAMVLLVGVGLSYLSWLPLNLLMPIREAEWVMVSFWFPATIFLTVLLRTALAFTVLSMAKERRERERRIEALTDALTGLANRRALFEAADNLNHHRNLNGQAISVLIFDLDHFKETNDRFGHALGDRVLKLFAAAARKHLDGASIIARLGGEEFAAIFPCDDPLEAAGAAEAVRHAFANAAAFADGLPVGATVSVGVAWEPFITGDLNALFRRADAALYVAKQAGRNRVELLGPDDSNPLAEVEAALRYACRASLFDIAEPSPAKLRA